MNWMSQFLKDIQGKYSFELLGTIAGKLQFYVELLQEKIEAIKMIVYKELDIATMQNDAAPHADKVVKAEPTGFSPQAAKYRVEEHDYDVTPPLSNVTEEIEEPSSDMVIAYQIRINHVHGEITLPEDSKEEEIEKAVLENCGFHLTTKRSARTEAVEDSYALTGFNSFASLFSKF